MQQKKEIQISSSLPHTQTFAFKERREGENWQDGASLYLYHFPSHGLLRFVTSYSCFAFVSEKRSA